MAEPDVFADPLVAARADVVNALVRALATGCYAESIALTRSAGIC